MKVGDTIKEIDLNTIDSKLHPFLQDSIKKILDKNKELYKSPVKSEGIQASIKDYDSTS